MQKKPSTAALENSTATNTLKMLATAYRATRYRAWCRDVPGGQLEIRVGAEHPVLDAWLRKLGFDCWSYLTADNPGSQILSGDENRGRFAALRAQLAESRRPFLIGESVADDGQWPPEASCLVPGLNQSAGVVLARRWGQNAFIYGSRGGVAKLCWLID